MEEELLIRKFGLGLIVFFPSIKIFHQKKENLSVHHQSLIVDLTIRTRKTKKGICFTLFNQSSFSTVDYFFRKENTKISVTTIATISRMNKSIQSFFR